MMKGKGLGIAAFLAQLMITQTKEVRGQSYSIGGMVPSGHRNIQKYARPDKLPVLPPKEYDGPVPPGCKVGKQNIFATINGTTYVISCAICAGSRKAALKKRALYENQFQEYLRFCLSNKIYTNLYIINEPRIKIDK